MGNMKCNICSNYLSGLERCKYCRFEYDESLFWTDDSQWDILEMDINYEWTHLQIMYRLKAKGIDCLSADIRGNDEIAYILGCTASRERVASALGVHKETVHFDYERGWIIINLFQEKYLRGELNG